MGYAQGPRFDPQYWMNQHGYMHLKPCSGEVGQEDLKFKIIVY